MFYATIAAVVCTQQTHEKTVNMGLHRMLGALIGGAVGYVVLVGLFLPACKCNAVGAGLRCAGVLSVFDLCVQCNGAKGVCIHLLHCIFEHCDARM